MLRKMFGSDGVKVSSLPGRSTHSTARPYRSVACGLRRQRLLYHFEVGYLVLVVVFVADFLVDELKRGDFRVRCGYRADDPVLGFAFVGDSEFRQAEVEFV